MQKVGLAPTFVLNNKTNKKLTLKFFYKTASASAKLLVEIFSSL